MFEPQVIRSEHKDVIHDVAYDYYGLRMATCSSDHTVKVWDKNEKGCWTVTASWKAHSGSVWRLSWAHPEFGQILATCSFDRTICVWEEAVGDKTTPTMTPVKRWFRRANLVDSRTNVTDVKFGPKHQGLLLASVSVDGVVRIYEALDIMNLGQWTLAYDVPCKLPLSCISWNNSMYRLHAPMIAVGSDDANSSGGKVFILEFTAGGSGKWTKTETINSITEPVHDIAFAPNVGRSYHILAVVGKDVNILNINSHAEANAIAHRLDIQSVAKFVDHNCTVWRTAWNVTGTMLATTGDDGYVRLWKMNHQRNWKCAAILKSDGSQSIQETITTATTTTNTPNASNTTTKYFKGSQISHSNQVPPY